MRTEQNKSGEIDGAVDQPKPRRSPLNPPAAARSGPLAKAISVYPSREFLRMARQLDTPITLGSDAHLPQETGQDFDKSAALARACGYTKKDLPVHTTETGTGGSVTGTTEVFVPQTSSLPCRRFPNLQFAATTSQTGNLRYGEVVLCLAACGISERVLKVVL
jgi:hypothetical protein